jgi:hypothetical protein
MEQDFDVITAQTAGLESTADLHGFFLVAGTGRCRADSLRGRAG